MRGGGAAADDDDGGGGCFVDDEVLVMVDEGLELAVRDFEVVDGVEVWWRWLMSWGRLRRGSGRLRWALLKGVCVRDDGGEV